MEASFLVKVIGQLAGDPGDLAELRVLIRVLRWTADCILLEADPRQRGSPLFAPGVKEAKNELATEEQFDAEATGKFRSDRTSLSQPRNYAGACPPLTARARRR